MQRNGQTHSIAIQEEETGSRPRVIHNERKWMHPIEILSELYVEIERASIVKGELNSGNLGALRIELRIREGEISSLSAINYITNLGEILIERVERDGSPPSTGIYKQWATPLTQAVNVSPAERNADFDVLLGVENGRFRYQLHPAAQPLSLLSENIPKGKER